MPKNNKSPVDENLQAFATLLKNLPTRQEFVDSFANVVKRVKAFEATLTRDFSNLVATLTKKVDDKLSTVKDGRDGNDGKDGKDGVDGKDSTVPGPKGGQGESVVGPAGKDGSPDTSEDIRNKLELFIGHPEEEKLKLEAIQGGEQLKKDVQEISLRPATVGGAKGIGLYIGGTKKLLTAQSINLIAGAGVSISYNHAYGRNDITISASGGGSLTILAATGTIDDSNTTFTFASTPTVVIVNGASYRNGHGCTITGTSVALDNAVGSGGDIYALG